MSILTLIQTYNVSTNLTLAALQGKTHRVTNIGTLDITVTLTGGTAYVLAAGKTVEFWYDEGSWKSNTITVTTPDDKADYIITDQTEFDAIFTGTISANTSIFLKRQASPFLLNNEVTLSSGVRIIGDGAIINRGVATARFKTGAKNSLGITSGVVGNNYFTMDATAVGIFSAGDIVSWNGLQFYEILSIATTQVNLTSPIRVAPSGTDILYSYTTDIFTEGWIFDGQNNANGFGGSFTAGFSGNGGAFYIDCVANSFFQAKVRNCKATGNGGGYASSGYCFNNIFENINNCIALGYGGGLYKCSNSVISKIVFCSANYGGGLSNCSNSNFHNIYACTATIGNPSHYNCTGSSFYDIYNCAVGTTFQDNIVSSSLMNNLSLTPTILTSGSFTPPEGATWVYALLFGAGGGGIASSTNPRGGSAGGIIDIFCKISDLKVGDTYPVTIGVGGAGNADGGNTFFNAIPGIYAIGGKKGQDPQIASQLFKGMKTGGIGGLGTGGGGGGGGGSGINGGDGVTSTNGLGADGGIAGTYGYDGGDGGDYGGAGNNGGNGGLGAGGGGSYSTKTPGSGGSGYIILWFF